MATIYTNPTPIISDTSGTLTWFNDPSYSTYIPSPDTSYNLTNDSGTIVSTFRTSANNENPNYFSYNEIPQKLNAPPLATTFDYNGNQYITSEPSVITIFNPNSVPTIFTILTKSVNNLITPSGISYCNNNGYIYVVNNSNSVADNKLGGITRFPVENLNQDSLTAYFDASNNSTFTSVNNNPITTILNNPYNLTFDYYGNIIYTNYGSSNLEDDTRGSVYVIYPDYATNTMTGSGGNPSAPNQFLCSAKKLMGGGMSSGPVVDTNLTYPSGIDMDNNNNLYVANIRNGGPGGSGPAICQYSYISSYTNADTASVTLLNIINTNSVGRNINTNPFTNLNIDYEYNNIYYIWQENQGGLVKIQSIIPPTTNPPTPTAVTITPIYSHTMNYDSQYNNNSSWSTAIYEGNIYIVINDSSISNTLSPIVQIQNAFTFSFMQNKTGPNVTYKIYPNNDNTPLTTLSINVPEATLQVSPINQYTNQTPLVIYYNNNNNLNVNNPISDGVYYLNSNDSTEFSSATITTNNETAFVSSVFIKEILSSTTINLSTPATITGTLVEVTFRSPNTTSVTILTCTLVAGSSVIITTDTSTLTIGMVVSGSGLYSTTMQNPYGMDFDSSGNLYVVNSINTEAPSGKSNISIITPNGGNTNITYNPSGGLVLNTLVGIRYHKPSNLMFVSEINSGSQSKIYKINTTITNQTTTNAGFNITYNLAWDNNDYIYSPIDIAFNPSFTNMFVSCSYTNTNKTFQITKLDIDADGIISNPNIIANYNISQYWIGYVLSGIAVDSSYVYVANTSSFISSGTTYSTITPSNILQITHDGVFYNYISPGKVGKQLDSNSQDYASLFPFNITGLTLDPYGNLYYIYCDASYGNYYVNAVSPNSYTTNIIYSHKIISNTLTPYTSVFAYGLVYKNGKLYVSQPSISAILQINQCFSFNNYGFGKKQSTFVLKNTGSNVYTLNGGTSSINNITINASSLNIPLDTSHYTTNPSPLIAGQPGLLYYYGNPQYILPLADTNYILLDKNGKQVSDVLSIGSTEQTIIYTNLSRPSSITYDSSGCLYTCNFGGQGGIYNNGSIMKFDENGNIIYTLYANANIKQPFGIKYNKIDGFIYYCNYSPNGTFFQIIKMTPDGNTLTTFFSDSSGNYVQYPIGLDFDSSGNLYVTTGNGPSSTSTISAAIIKITISYTGTSSSPINVTTFANGLSGLTNNVNGVPSISGIVVDNISNYLYVVTGDFASSPPSINISQIPTTGNDSGNVTRKWNIDNVGNAISISSLCFDPYGNLYYIYYVNSTTCYIKAFNPYTNTENTFTHQLLGNGLQNTYGIAYYNGYLYVSKSGQISETSSYIDNILKIQLSFLFTGVTLQNGENILTIKNLNNGTTISGDIYIRINYPIYYTIPAPPIAGSPAILVFEYDNVIIPVNGHSYVLLDAYNNYVSSILVYNSSTEQNPFTFTFLNLILPGGVSNLVIFDITQGIILSGSNMRIKIPIICFYKGTKILCAINGKDTYVPIEKIGEGTIVKTYKHGYKSVKYNVMGKLNNSAEHSIDKLFKLSKKRFPGLTEDLYVTGSHALLHDRLNKREIVLMQKVIKFAAEHYNSIYNAMIDDKFKLLAYHDERFEEIMIEKTFEIYHIVLENENHNYNYGIYANGILAESTDELTLMRMKGYTTINKTSDGLSKFLKSLDNNKKYKLVK